VQSKGHSKVSEEEKRKIATLVLAFVGHGAIQGALDMKLYHGPTVLTFAVTTTPLPARKAILAATKDPEEEEEADGSFVMVSMTEATDPADDFVWLEKGDCGEVVSPDDALVGSPTSVMCTAGWGEERLACSSSTRDVIVQVQLNIGAVATDIRSAPATDQQETNEEPATGTTENLESAKNTNCQQSERAVSTNSLLEHYASMGSIEAIGHAIVDGVKESGQGRKYLLQTVIRGLHPDKQKGDIGDKIIAERVAKIANTIKGHFTDNNLWDRPNDWTSHIKYLSRDQL
jgi:hypothetical protein